MTEARVLQGLDVRGTRWVLARPANTGAVPLPAAAAALSPMQQLEQRYAAGVRDGQAAEAERADRERQATEAHELKAALEQAEQRGYVQGQARALDEASQAAAEAEREIQRRTAALETIATSLAGQADAALDGIEDELVGLCHDVICRVLGAAAATPAGIHALVLQALSELPGQVCVIHLHPEDLANIQSGGLHGFDKRIRWVADSAISVGGAIVKSEAGSLDARLETQMRALADTLRQARRQQGAGPGSGA